MLNQFSRTELLLGSDAMKKLSGSHVAVFGIGGVGGFTVEALARSGVGTFDLFDNDTVCLTNINRQIIATIKTIGKYKVDLMKERILDINPEAVINVHRTFYTPENANQYDFSKYDYIVDAIDTITSKIEIVMRAEKINLPVISCMGAGNKLDPTKFQIADIYKTSVCPLAKVMRRELRVRGIKKLKVLYSTELPRTPINSSDSEKEVTNKRQTPGSTSFVPSVAGLIIAGEVIKDITGIR